MDKTKLKVSPQTDTEAGTTFDKELVREQGNIVIRKWALACLTAITLALVIGGFFNSHGSISDMKDMWFVLVPLISVAISGIIGIALGSRQQQ